MKLSAPIFRLKRQARRMARAEGLALHDALDRLARQEGFRSWSHLAAQMAQHRPEAPILDWLVPGDFVLLGGRPGHGKTRLGLQLAAAAGRAGRRAAFFTLDYTEADVLDGFRAAGVDPVALNGQVELDTSDEICAAHVIGRLRNMPAGSLVVIDYLQLLDQKRRHPPLADQVAALKDFAARAGLIVVLITQIDRSFEQRTAAFPGLGDVRLPNPLDLRQFTKACFIHDGAIRLTDVA